MGLTVDWTIATSGHVSGYGTLIVPGRGSVQALRIDLEKTIAQSFGGAPLDVTTTNPIQFITRDGVDA